MIEMSVKRLNLHAPSGSRYSSQIQGANMPCRSIMELEQSERKTVISIAPMLCCLAHDHTCVLHQLSFYFLQLLALFHKLPSKREHTALA